MILKPHELGTYFESDFFFGLFGNCFSNIESISTYFPTIKFKRIKQLHGDKIVHTSPHAIDFSSEADSHFSNEKNLGLCISTADCLPIFLAHDKPSWIVGIHAGWRGIENRLVPKSIATIIRHSCVSQNIKVLIGPHIERQSFEVKDDVRDLLMNSFLKPSKLEFYDQKNDGHSFVDLQLILKEQLLESQISPQNIYLDSKNTFTDLQYHSFRRDRESAGRQLSWIALR